jgi:hypothetical protein
MRSTTQPWLPPLRKPNKVGMAFAAAGIWLGLKGAVATIAAEHYASALLYALTSAVCLAFVLELPRTRSSVFVALPLQTLAWHLHRQASGTEAFYALISAMFAVPLALEYLFPRAEPMTETAVTPQAAPANDAGTLAQRACISGAVSLIVPVFAFLSIVLARRALKLLPPESRAQDLVSAALTMSCTSLFTWTIVTIVLAYK